MIGNFIERMRLAFENLNERERRLVLILISVFAVFLIALPGYALATTFAELSRETDELRSVLSDIKTAESDIRARLATREASLRRYDQSAPALGSFLEQQAKSAGYDRSLPKLNDQPEKTIPGFRRRHTKLTLTAIDLETIIKLLTSIKNSPLPVAIESVRIDHFAGRDKYNIQLGVIAFDRRNDDAPEDSRDET